jgi:hypothetical protein
MKMACCVDVHLKQLAVTEFLMGEEESLTNIYQQKMLVVSQLLIKAPSIIGLLVASSKNGQAGLIDACSRAVGVQKKCQ